MFQILFKYLLINKQVNIPGIGELKLIQEPARVDLANLVIKPPYSTIQFNKVSATADKNFFRFASNEMQVEDWKTISRFHEFLFKLKSKLDSDRSVELPGIGVLNKDATGQILFEPENLQVKYFKDLPLPGSKPEVVVPQTFTEEINITPATELVIEAPVTTDNKRLWWILTIVFALLAIAAIIYYYLEVYKPANY